jgi:hypothetical protein
MTNVATASEATVPDPTPARAARWRRWTAGTLIVLSCILAPISVLAVWVRNQLLNTDRYVENVTPLATNPAIISTVSADVTNQLFERVDVEQVAKDALPPRASFLAAPLAAALREAVGRVSTTVLESDQFKTAWVEANRIAHEQLRKALTNEGKVVTTDKGHVVLDLSSLVTDVKARLRERGINLFDKTPAGQANLKVELLDADQLASVQRATSVLNHLSWFLPLLAVVCLAGGLALSSNRRRSLLRWGIGTAFAVALVGVGLSVGRSFYLDAVTSPSLPRDAAAAVFDTLVRFLREGVRLIIAVGLVVAIGAWLTGPSTAAVRLRATARRAIGTAGGAAGSHGWGFGKFGDWVATHRAGMRIGASLVVLGILLLWDHPRGLTVVLLALLLLVLFGLIEFVARAAISDGHPPDSSVTTPPVGAPPPTAT